MMMFSVVLQLIVRAFVGFLCNENFTSTRSICMSVIVDGVKFLAFIPMDDNIMSVIPTPVCIRFCFTM